MKQKTAYWLVNLLLGLLFFYLGFVITQERFTLFGLMAMFFFNAWSINIR